jgi:hypothetical protein
MMKMSIMVCIRTPMYSMFPWHIMALPYVLRWASSSKKPRECWMTPLNSEWRRHAQTTPLDAEWRYHASRDAVARETPCGMQLSLFRTYSCLSCQVINWIQFWLFVSYFPPCFCTSFCIGHAATLGWSRYARCSANIAFAPHLHCKKM